MLRLLPAILMLGCGGLLPPSASARSALDLPLCLEANERYQSWHAVGVVFTSLGSVTSGGSVLTEFVTDETWVPAAISIGGIVFSGLAVAGHILADDAAGDVVRYCGEVDR